MKNVDITIQDLLGVATSVINELNCNYTKFMQLIGKLADDIIFNIENFALLYIIPHYREHKHIKKELLKVKPYSDILGNYTEDELKEKIEKLINVLNENYDNQDYALMYIITITQKFLLYPSKYFKDHNQSSIDDLFSIIMTYCLFTDHKFEDFINRKTMGQTITHFIRDINEHIITHFSNHNDFSMKIQIFIMFINTFLLPYISLLHEQTENNNLINQANTPLYYVEPKNYDIN